MGLGVRSESERQGCDFFFEHARGIFHDADVVIGNLEGLLHEPMGVESQPLPFCGSPSFAEAMKRAGITLVTVANNHTLEHGSCIFEETVSLLEKSGVSVCGLRCQEGIYHSKPVILEIKAKKIGFLAYNWVGVDKFPESDRHIAQSRNSLVNYTWNRDVQLVATPGQANANLISDVRLLKQEVDYVVLLPHWGYEFVHYPPLGVIQEAKSFIEAGADMIIGSHPHVLQGMEYFSGKPVFYSLGNFIFDFRPRSLRYTAILSTEISDDWSVNYYFSPFIIGKNFQPRPAKGRDARCIQEILGKYIDIRDNHGESLNDDCVYREYEKRYNRLKLQNIIYHFTLLPSHPSLGKVIMRKFFSAVCLAKSRLQGNKIRW